MIETAQEKIDEIKNTIRELNQIRMDLQNMERNLRQLEQQQNHGNGQGNGNGQNNNGNGHNNQG